jgi:hypothetical protein
MFVHGHRLPSQHHEVGELIQEHTPWATPSLFLNLVGTVRPAAPLCLVRAEAGVRVDLEALRHLVGREHMPDRMIMSHNHYSSQGTRRRSTRLESHQAL